jgi:hypothetical protein
MPDTIARAIVAQVKRKKGCSLRDLHNALPRRYRYTDYLPEHFLRDPLLKLLRWNLIQAWKGGTLLVSCPSGS